MKKMYSRNSVTAGHRVHQIFPDTSVSSAVGSLLGYRKFQIMLKFYRPQKWKQMKIKYSLGGVLH
jgi:hypothetical protein